MIPIEPSWSLGHIETFGSTKVGDGWLKYMTMRGESRGVRGVIWKEKRNAKNRRKKGKET